MTLQQIRQCTNETELIQAVRDLVDFSPKMGFGDMLAMRREIISAADRIGVSIEKLNRIAEGERDGRG